MRYERRTLYLLLVVCLVGAVPVAWGEDRARAASTANRGWTNPSLVEENTPGWCEFDHSSLVYDDISEAADGVSSGAYWPVTDPVTTSVFVGSTASHFFGHGNVLWCWAYNANCMGSKVNPDEYSIYQEHSLSYDSSAAAGRQTWAEQNINYSPPTSFGDPDADCTGPGSPYSCCTGASTGTCEPGWRASHFTLDTTANLGGGGARWTFTANNLRRGGAPGSSNNSLDLHWPWVAINHVNSIDVNTDASLSNWARMNLYDPGGTQYGFKSRMIFEADNAACLAEGVPMSCCTGLGTGTCETRKARREYYGIASQVDLSTTADIDPGYIAAFQIPAPTDAGNPGTTVNGYVGLRIDDLKLDRAPFGAGVLPNAAILVRSQSTTDGGEGNIVMAGGGYATGHYVAGSTHLWEESAGILAVSRGTPGSAAAGTRVVTNARSTTSGPAAWAATGVSCESACTNIGQANCSNSIPLEGRNTPTGDCTDTSGHRVCECY